MFWFKKKEPLFPELKVGDYIYLKDFGWEDVNKKCGFAITMRSNLLLKTNIKYKICYMFLDVDDIFINVDKFVVKISRFDIDRVV